MTIDPVLGVLLGAIIGAGASIATVWIQSRQQATRDRARLAADLAMHDYTTLLDLAKSSGKPFQQNPLILFVHYHMELTKLIEAGELTPAKVERLSKSNIDILLALQRADKAARERASGSA